MVNPRRPRRSRRIARPALARVALVTLAGLGVLGLTACSVTNPMTTKNNYAASDGVRVELGEVTVINLLVLTAAQGQPGTVLGAVANHGRERVGVTIALTDDTTQDTSFDVAGGGTVVVGPERDETLDLDATPAAPGALVELTLT